MLEKLFATFGYVKTDNVIGCSISPSQNVEVGSKEVWTEQNKLSLECGEFMHSIANLIIDKKITIDGLSRENSNILMEISQALRHIPTESRHAPLLLSYGFDVSKYPRSSWLNLASYLINEPNKPLDELVELINKTALK